MARTRRPARQSRRVEGQTNWLVVGGIVAAAVIAFGALLALALREPEVITLAEYCQANPASCPAKGEAEAPVTIVEVSDYGCGHCRNFNLDTAGLLEDLYVTPGQVRWAVLPYALSAQTTPAAEAALCANDQGGFFEFHHKMFEMQELPIALTAAGFLQAAGELELDVAAFEACFEGQKYANAVQDNIRAATLAGVNSTPTFFVNGQMFKGNRPSEFQQLIEAALP